MKDVIISSNSVFFKNNKIINKLKGFSSEIIIENLDFYFESDETNIWVLIESDNINQNYIKLFNSDDLKDIYLISKEADEYSIPELHKEYCCNFENCEIFNKNGGYNFCEEKQNLYEKIIQLINENSIELKESFLQLKNINSFLFSNLKNSQLTDFDKIIHYIEILMHFFESESSNLRIKIYENNKKIKIHIFPLNNIKNNGTNIFDKSNGNFYNFLNSTYDEYKRLKELNFEIDLLIYYFLWIKNERYNEVKTLLGTIFLESFKNFNETNNNNHIFNKLKNRFDELHLDLDKLFYVFFFDECQFLNNIEKSIQFKHVNKKDQEKIKKIIKEYKEYYFLENLVFYRNRIVHTGKIRILEKDNSEIFNKVFKKLNKKYNRPSIVLLNEINKFIIEELKKINFNHSIFKQEKIFEHIIEIILMTLLNVDCSLVNSTIFKAQNSKEYISHFLKI